MTLGLPTIFGICLFNLFFGADADVLQRDPHCYFEEIYDQERDLCLFTMPYWVSQATYSPSLCSFRYGGGVRASAHNQYQINLLLGFLSYKYNNDNEEQFYWMGGSYNYNIGAWEWEDGTPFDWQTNWENGEYTYSHIALKISNGKFVTYDPNVNLHALCQGPTVFNMPTPSPRPCPTSAPVTCPTCPSAPVCPSNTKMTNIPCPTNKPSILSACPSGWSIFSDTVSCYTVFFSASWNTAEELCGGVGGHLTSIHSFGENAFVAKLTRTYLNATDPLQMTWTGLSYETGLWRWSDSSPVDFINWAPKEPTSPTTKQCAMISQDGATQVWYTADCDSHMRAYVCKKTATH